MTREGKGIVAGVALAVAAVAASLLAVRGADPGGSSRDPGYAIIARFDNAGALDVGAPVRMAGVRIGRVSGIGFDRETYQAVVTMSIKGEFDYIPADTSASIFTAGLMGEQYVALEPGGDQRMARDRDELTLTQSAIVLEQVVGQFLYNQRAPGGPWGGN